MAADQYGVLKEASDRGNSCSRFDRCDGKKGDDFVISVTVHSIACGQQCASPGKTAIKCTVTEISELNALSPKSPKSRRINDICLGKHGITANIALRLGKFFDVDPQWFMNMQAKI